MFRFRHIVLILFITHIDGNSNILDILIQRIRKEDGVFTVCLFRKDDIYLDDILLQISNIPVLVFDSVVKDFKPQVQFSKNILPVPIFKDQEEEHWYFSQIEKLTYTVPARRFVVVIYGSSPVKLERSFAWFTEHKFVRMFGILGDQVLTYFPYAVEKLRQVPENGPLPDSMRDLNGHNIRTNIQVDAPRAFAYRDKKGRRIIGGYAAETFVGFIRKHKARYTEVPLFSLSDYDIPRVINATVGGEIDISMNPYIQMPSIQLSYPIRFVRWTLLIPHNEYINPNQYFTRPFSGGVWITIAGLVAYITLLNIVVDFVMQFDVDPWHSLSMTFCAFLNLSSERYVQHAFRFHAQVLLIAFVLYNLYSVHLTSFLTVFIKAPQAYTLQDLIDYKIRLLVMDTEVVLMPLANMPRGFRNIVTGVPINELNQQRYSARNKSFAYAVPSDKAEYILNQQMYLHQPNFHISKDSMLDVNFAFMLPKDSPFVDILSAHVLQELAMGLTHKWERDAVYQGVEAGILHMLEYKPKMPTPLTLRHLSFAWNCLGVGLVGASVAFLVEISKRRVFTFICPKNLNE